MAIVWQNEAIKDYAPAERRSFWLTPSWKLKAAYLCLQQVDLVLTIFAVYHGFAEMNPLMRSMLASPFQLLTVKLFIPLLIVWLVPGRLLAPAIILLSLVIGWNFKELFLLF